GAGGVLVEIRVIRTNLILSTSARAKFVVHTSLGAGGICYQVLRYPDPVVSIENSSAVENFLLRLWKCTFDVRPVIESTRTGFVFSSIVGPSKEPINHIWT